MDYKIIWTEDAVQDFTQAVEYIARDSEIYASSFATDVFKAVNSLARLPLRCPLVSELERPDIRLKRLYISVRLVDYEKNVC